MTSDDDTTIRQRLERDGFYLGALLLQGVDENIKFCQPFFLYQVHGRGAFFPHKMFDAYYRGEICQKAAASPKWFRMNT